MDLIELMKSARAAEAAQDECDDPDCACHDEDADEAPGDGAAEVTMTEVYGDGPAFGPRR
jgi:hypothetical protein